MTEEIENEDDWVSKTERKKACDVLQKLGEELITLKISELDSFDLSDTLYAAIKETHKITKHGALKRQKHFIGKLMRDADAESIEKQLIKVQHKDDVNTARFQHIEQWRDRIIEEGDKALPELLSEFPQVDRQHIRQLFRNARKEQEKNKPPVAARQIFKYLRDLPEN
jgi:ribosome-associated protein